MGVGKNGALWRAASAWINGSDSPITIVGVRWPAARIARCSPLNAPSLISVMRKSGRVPRMAFASENSLATIGEHPAAVRVAARSLARRGDGLTRRTRVGGSQPDLTPAR